MNIRVQIFLLTLILIGQFSNCTNSKSKYLCVEYDAYKFCCDSTLTTFVPVITNYNQYIQHKYFDLINKKLGDIDFSSSNLIIVARDEMHLTLEKTGEPNTLATPFQFYKQFDVYCFSDTVQILLDCSETDSYGTSPTAGFGSEFYWKKVSKTINSSVECKCNGVSSKVLDDMDNKE